MTNLLHILKYSFVVALIISVVFGILVPIIFWPLDRNQQVVRDRERQEAEAERSATDQRQAEAPLTQLLKS
jgi:hypothetical protein